MSNEISYLNMKLKFVLFQLIFFLSCDFIQQKGNDDHANVGIDIDEPSNTELDEYQKNNKIGILMLIKKEDTLMILSDRKLTWRPFGDLSSQKDLERLSNSFSDSTVSFVKNPDTNAVEKVIEFIHQDSHAKILIGRDDLPQIIESRILDTQIVLSYGIHIGMTKENFFSTLFVDPSPKLHYFNVVENYDPPGEFIEETFVFRGDTLSEIIMKAPFTWLD